MSWSVVRCQYEGGGYGEPVEILVETDEHREAYRLIRDNESKIDRFYEHSVQEDHMYPVDHPSFSYQDMETEEDVKEVLSDPFNPDYAIFSDGRVAEMVTYGNVDIIED